MTFYAPFCLPFIIGAAVMFAVLAWKWGTWLYRLPRADKKRILFGLPTRRTFSAIGEVVGESLLHRRIFRVNPLLGYMHMSLAFGWFLLIAVGVIVAESIGRMLHPAPVEGGAIAWTAGVGVAINGFTAWLFLKDKDRDLNVKGAYLHMAADALVSVGVLVSGLVISWTGWTIVDPVVGLVVAAVIVASVWSLTRDSLRLSLDGVPGEIDVAAIGRKMTDVPGVKAVHHIHVWAISTTENALTAHVVLESLSRMEEVKHDLKDLLNHAGISHATLEFESAAERCDDLHD